MTEKVNSLLPPDLRTTVHKIPSPSRSVRIGEFDPIIDEQLGITPYFELFVQFIMDKRDHIFKYAGINLTILNLAKYCPFAVRTGTMQKSGHGP